MKSSENETIWESGPTTDRRRITLDVSETDVFYISEYDDGDLTAHIAFYGPKLLELAKFIVGDAASE